MKKLFSIPGLLIFLMACEEKPPNIPLEAEDNNSGIKDTTYVAANDTSGQEKRVLIEDFTAVRCNNCPKAADIVEALIDEHGDRIVPLAVHSNQFFSRPYPESKENYMTDKGQSLYEWFGTPPQPAGAVDRFVFQGEENASLDYNKWKQKAGERLNATTNINVYLDSEYDSTSNTVTVGLKLWFLEALEGSFYYTLVLTENNIIDYQLSQEEGKIPDYEHDHLVRKIPTAYNGDLAIKNPQRNAVVQKGFQIELESDWKPGNMEIVGFVHKKLEEKTVFQANKIALQ